MIRAKNILISLQDRDFKLLRGLFECRVMTAGQIATLYFDGKREYTKTRMTPRWSGVSGGFLNLAGGCCGWRSIQQLNRTGW
jgi:hypothetical protein